MSEVRLQPGAFVKPRALGPGATLAIVSPASTPQEELVRAGVARLNALGYKTVIAPHALARGPLYYAGTREQRLKDLHDAFADPAIDGILCTRGGWGSAELLPFLDAALIRANPKAFVGYSDHTSLHIWLREHAGVVTFYAPMCAADFSREDGVDLASWNHCFGGSETWSLGNADGLRILRPGVAEGTLDGGCLSIYAESLGTPYAPAHGPEILFVEDIGVKPYQWDRLLVHLRLAGMLERVAGIVFGDMRQCVDAEQQELLERSILHSLAEFAGPIAIGLRSGHVATQNISLPLGVRARLDLRDAGDPRLDLLETAVSE